MTNNSTRLAITNPLVLYRSFVARNSLRSDPEQLRLAIHLEKLYDKLKEYKPPADFAHRIAKLQSALAAQPRDDPSVSPSSRLLRTPPSFWRTVLGITSSRSQNDQDNVLALTRITTDMDAAAAIDAPRGMLVTGPVGCGKSMLVDLFCDALPVQGKRRWHFSAFMLWVLRRLHVHRVGTSSSSSSSLSSSSALAPAQPQQLPEFVLVSLARELMEASPVLVIDEFQMPDRMAAKTISGVLAVFFRLGGVLVATSNRLPDELAKASGLELGLRSSSRMPANQEFAGFLELLRARCEVFEVNATTDYRRLEDEKKETIIPTYYSVTTEHDAEIVLLEGLLQKKGISISSTDFAPKSLTVFARNLVIPHYKDGIAVWKFEDLCAARLGPADYISLASTCHTFIITHIPILTIALKNEARRFITLLDALYECRCRLAISASALPDDLFFPEREDIGSSDEDALHSETFAEVHQDLTAPFRPNISAYSLASDALEDDPPNRIRREAMPGATEMERLDSLGTSRDTLNFADSGAFTGEDEKFAWKRAASRLWEMCHDNWWQTSNWRPLAIEERVWENPRILEVAQEQTKAYHFDQQNSQIKEKGERIGAVRHVSEDQDKVLYQHGASPFRRDPNPPPRIQPEHVWGLQKWGKKSGAWGQGVDGLAHRHDSKEKERKR